MVKKSATMNHDSPLFTSSPWFTSNTSPWKRPQLCRWRSSQTRLFGPPICRPKTCPLTSLAMASVVAGHETWKTADWSTGFWIYQFWGMPRFFLVDFRICFKAPHDGNEKNTWIGSWNLRRCSQTSRRKVKQRIHVAIFRTLIIIGTGQTSTSSCFYVYKYNLNDVQSYQWWWSQLTNIFFRWAAQPSGKVLSKYEFVWKYGNPNIIVYHQFALYNS